MKEKIFLLIIGVLVGAVITTGVFFTYTLINNSSKCRNKQIQMNGGQPPSMPNGNNNQPPEMPNENNNQKNDNKQQPEKTEENTSQNNTQDNNSY